MSSVSNYAQSATQVTGNTPWNNVGGIVGSALGNYATIAIVLHEVGNLLNGYNYGFTVGETQTLDGVGGGFWAYATVDKPGGATELQFSLSQAGPFQKVTLTPTPTFYSVGGPTDLWGQSSELLKGVVQTQAFGAFLNPLFTNRPPYSTARFYVNTLPITLFLS